MKQKEGKIKYNTIIIDTATELETVLRQYVFEEIAAASVKNRGKLAPNEYVRRNMFMSALFGSAAEAGINLVSLQYMKPRWEKDAKGNLYDTGEKIIDGWQRTESQSDVNILMNKRVATIESNWADPKLDGKTFDSPDYETIVAEILINFLGEDEDYPNLVFSVTGDAKSGKTHFAYTFPEPIKVFSFNRGSIFVIRKFPMKQIDVEYYPLPVIDEEKPEPWATPIWEKFYKEYKATVGG